LIRQKIGQTVEASGFAEFKSINSKSGFDYFCHYIDYCSYVIF